MFVKAEIILDAGVGSAEYGIDDGAATDYISTRTDRKASDFKDESFITPKHEANVPGWGVYLNWDVVRWEHVNVRFSG